MIGIIFFRQGQSQSQANLNFTLMTSLFGNYGELASADPSADWVVTFSLQNKEFGLGVGWVGGMNAKWCEVICAQSHPKSQICGSRISRVSHLNLHCLSLSTMPRWRSLPAYRARRVQFVLGNTWDLPGVPGGISDDLGARCEENVPRTAKRVMEAHTEWDVNEMFNIVYYIFIYNL